MQEIWIVWEYDNCIRPESYIYDVFLSEKVAKKCVETMNRKQNGYFYELEKVYAHSAFVPDEDQ